MDSSQADPSATDQPPQPQSAGVQPLPEQFCQRKQLRRSARLACYLDKLAVVELQLVLQFLDTGSKLKAARCSQRLLHAASAPFAWRSEPVFVEASAAEHVERARTSLLRFAPIHLRCIGVATLGSVTAVPHLWTLELMKAPESSATDLSQLLRHSTCARLQLLGLDSQASRLLTTDTMRLISRLPQLHTLDLAVLREQATDAGFFSPLTDAVALTDLALYCDDWTIVSATMLGAISQCAKLQRLCLSKLVIRGVHLLIAQHATTAAPPAHKIPCGWIMAPCPWIWRLQSAERGRVSGRVQPSRTAAVADAGKSLRHRFAAAASTPRAVTASAFHSLLA